MPQSLNHADKNGLYPVVPRYVPYILHGKQLTENTVAEVLGDKSVLITRIYAFSSVSLMN